MENEIEKRASYSIFFFPSVLHGRQLRLDDNRALERTLIELETTQGLLEWDFANAEAPFLFGGKQRKARLKLVARRSGARRQLLQLVPGKGGDIEQAAIAAGRMYATDRGFDHMVLADNRPACGPHERQNRDAAHAWLRSANRWDTSKLEKRVVQLVTGTPARLSTLSAEMSLSSAQVRLVFVRAWLNEQVRWDIGQEAVTDDLLVRPA